MNELSPTDLMVVEGVTVGVKPSRIVKNLFGVAVQWPVCAAITVGFWFCVLTKRAGQWPFFFNYFVLFVVFVAHGATFALPFLAFTTLRRRRRRRRYVISREYLQAVETVGGYDRVLMQVPLRNVAWVGLVPLVGRRIKGLFLDVRDLEDAETLLPGWKERTRRQLGHDYQLVAVQCDWDELIDAVNCAMDSRGLTSEESSSIEPQSNNGDCGD